jgi:pimeloyl-ACP methyl ester carboxylesterase
MSQTNTVIKRKLSTLFMAMAALGLTACLEETRNTDLQNSLNQDKMSSEESTFIANFDPANGVIPFPNNLLFAGVSGDDGLVAQAADGTVNVPYGANDSDASVKAALSALDGFSTVAPITMTFSSTIDAATIKGNVRVFEVSSDPATKAVTAVVAELQALDPTDLAAGGDYVLSTSGTTLAIVPLKPLKPKTSYLVTVNNGVGGRNGDTVTSSIAYLLAKRTTSLLNEGRSVVPVLSDDDATAFESVRLLTNAAEAVVQAYTVTTDAGDVIADLNAADIALSWSFSTQSVGDVLAQVYAQKPTNPLSSVETTAITTLTSKSDLYKGVLDVPYYLDKTAPLSSAWQYEVSDGVYGIVHAGNPLSPATKVSASKSTETIPLLLSIPNEATIPTGKPADGWPTVIFQHGITRNRTDMIALADTLAAIGVAVVAIDLPLHGIVVDSDVEVSSLSAAQQSAHIVATSFEDAPRERTFSLDLVVQNDAGSIVALGGGDGPDSSGRHFVNLASLLTTRDNLRQGASDLFALTSALDSLSYDGDDTADFDTDKIYFVGHSLGGMVGTLYLQHETRVRDAVLAMPGGGVANLMLGSPTFGPEIIAGLAAEGLAHGSAEFEAFMVAAQTVLDSADPLNAATDEVKTGRGVLMLEIAGDQVVPNDVVGAPLSGATGMVISLALDRITSNSAGADVSGVVTLSEGDHASTLDPGASAAATAAIHTLLASFVLSDGSVIDVEHDSVSGVVVQ